jgi:hypothetical protein
MQSRAAEYRMDAVVCAAQASAAPDPMKHFYQALELQWVCLAQQAEREAVTSQQDEMLPRARRAKLRRKIVRAHVRVSIRMPSMVRNDFSRAWGI